jgi:CopG family transcriptional regulator / antitoxin EndoAI
MRSSHTFTISLPPDLAAEVDRLAAEEHRSRSELFREAFRRYVNSQRRWDRILDVGPRAARAAGLASEEAIDAAVDQAVRDVRRERRASEV